MEIAIIIGVTIILTCLIISICVIIHAKEDMVMDLVRLKGINNQKRQENDIQRETSYAWAKLAFKLLEKEKNIKIDLNNIPEIEE